MERTSEVPRVVAGVLIRKDGRILIGKRKGGNGAGEWGVPGGHLELHENPEDCIAREAFEETGLRVKNIRFCFAANVTRFFPHQYIYLGFTADWESGEVLLKEPDKCEEWLWCPLENMPEGIRTVPDVFAAAVKSGQVYFPNVI